jgi:hypothetical protein
MLAESVTFGLCFPFSPPSASLPSTAAAGFARNSTVMDVEAACWPVLIVHPVEMFGRR